MANSFSYRHGQRKLVSCPVASSTVIEIGDLVYVDGSEMQVFPASDFPWDSNLATTQASFADVFLGVAVHPSADGDTDDVDVDISADSVYQFSVASATYDLKSTLGPDKDTGNALLSQTLEAAVAASSVAQSLEVKSSATTLLNVSFASAFNPSANSAGGALG